MHRQLPCGEEGAAHCVVRFDVFCSLTYLRVCGACSTRPRAQVMQWGPSWSPVRTKALAGRANTYVASPSGHGHYSPRTCGPSAAKEALQRRRQHVKARTTYAWMTTAVMSQARMTLPWLKCWSQHGSKAPRVTAGPHQNAGSPPTVLLAIATAARHWLRLCTTATTIACVATATATGVQAKHGKAMTGTQRIAAEVAGRSSVDVGRRRRSNGMLCDATDDLYSLSATQQAMKSSSSFSRSHPTATPTVRPRTTSR